MKFEIDLKMKRNSALKKKIGVVPDNDYEILKYAWICLSELHLSFISGENRLKWSAKLLDKAASFYMDSWAVGSGSGFLFSAYLYQLGYERLHQR